MKKFNFYFGATVSTWLLALMVIAAELFAPFKELLVGVFSHHWIGKGILVAIAFIAAGYLFSEKKTFAGKPVADAAWYSTLGSMTVILLFFIIEFLV